jgi:broad specificity phosphatase PhoE
MSSPSTRLLLVRHGETPWNASGRWQGHANPGLTERGAAQAAEAARAIRAAAPCDWTGIVSSDLDRALRTARAIASLLGLPVETDRRLRERDVGRWSGLTRAEIERVDPETLAAFDTGRPEIRPGGGESRIEVVSRALDFVREIVERRAGERLILVTHLGVIRGLVPEAEPGNAERIEALAEEILAQGGALEQRREGSVL